MDFDYLFRAGLVAVGLISAWTMRAANISDKKAEKIAAELAEAKAEAASAKAEAASAKAEADRAKEDIASIKSDIHLLTNTMIESINKLDSRLHNFIVAQVKTGTKQ